MSSNFVKLFGGLIVAVLLAFPQPAGAFSLEHPEKAGVAVLLGSSYDPQPTYRIVQVSWDAIYDYERIMHHPAPEPLRFKLAGNLGFVSGDAPRLLASVNFFALYYLRALQTRTWSPYLEAGAGLVYGDFQVAGQAFRVNFNPQAGVGTEWQDSQGQLWYGGLRAYHISNGNLHRDNRGLNGVVLQLGRYF
jgi:lipid A 3-O-deacylase